MTNDWRVEQTTMLGALHAKGHSASEIGRIVGRSRNAVLGKLFRLGMRFDPASRPKRIKTISAPKPRVKVERLARAPIVATKPAVKPIVGAPSADCNPRPWLTRGRGECAYPIDGPDGAVLSCCNATSGVYCAGHVAIMHDPRPLRKIQPPMEYGVVAVAS